MKQFFRRKIRNGEYEFYFARNGVEALDVLNSTPGIEIILLDINMPEMDGLTLLSKVNEMHNPALRVIMVSAYGDMANIRQAMNNGAFDFATKPIDMDDLSLTIEKAIKQINYVHESQKEHSQLESLKKDLTTARNLFCNFACTSIIKLFKLCLFGSQSSSCPSFMLYTTTSLLAAKLSSCCWLSALSFSFNRASLTPAAAVLLQARHRLGAVHLGVAGREGDVAGEPVSGRQLDAVAQRTVELVDVGGGGQIVVGGGALELGAGPTVFPDCR